MADWLSSMQRSFEFYEVDPNTWKDRTRLTNVTSCTINWDSEAQTLGSATIDVVDTLGECYVRIYMITIQNGLTEKHPLGTFLVQTPSSEFDGKIRTVSMDAYTPLLELKENQPPLGYSILKGSNIMTSAYQIAREYTRAPVIKTHSDEELKSDFVSNTDDTWMSFLIDLIANAKFTFYLDELGRVLFSPLQNISSLQPVWTYNDDNSSILLPSVTLKHDIYGIPNKVEVIYSSGYDYYRGIAINDDPNSPISTINRGRTIPYRVINPQFSGEATESQIQEYAEQLLESLSSVEYTVSYSHGYCPVRVGDCVRLNYTSAGIKDVKAKVISQSIKCDTECTVTETAVYTMKLWG